MEEIRVPRIGDIVEGEVVYVDPQTVYVNIFAPTEGKIDIENFGDPAITSFEDVIRLGDTIRAQVKYVSYDKELVILLSRKALIKEEQFAKIEADLAEKAVVKAKVKNIMDKGLVLSYLNHELFLPFSHLDYELLDKKDQLKNQMLEVVLLEINQKGRFTRIVASRRPLIELRRKEENEKRQALRQKELDDTQTGDILEGVVEKIENYGAYVKFEHITGLLRSSQVSHHRIEKLEDYLHVGQNVRVKVIKKENNRLDLSMKALLDTPFDGWIKTHHVGSEVSGVVIQKLPFGMIVELDKDVRGLLHKNEFTWNPNDNFEAYVKLNDCLDLVVISIDEKKEKIGLSKKQLEDNPWKNVTVRRGDMVKGNVTRIDKEGVYIEVQGVEALIPNQELSNEKLSRVEDYFAQGDEIEAVVIDANPKQWILKLSIRQVLEKQARESFEKYLKEENDDMKVTLGDFMDDLKK